MSPRYTRNVEAAKAALAAGFKSAAAQKEAAECLSRAYEEVRDAIRRPMDAERHADLFWSIPDLHNWKPKHGAAVVAAFPELAGACAMADELVALRATIKAAPIAKPESKKAATERKVAAIKEAVAAGVASPIALAIAPLRKEAADNARAWATQSAADARAKLEAAGFNLDTLVPRPGRGASKAEYAMAAEARAHYFQFLKAWSAARTSYVLDEAAAQRYIDRAVRDTEASFDAFVLKLDGKVGAHKAATLVAGATWSYSILRVTLADGTVQDWKTQRITNCSSLGRLFNQWPTRIVMPTGPKTCRWPTKKPLDPGFCDRSQ